MNYREKMRKAIECPQFGNRTYGKWCALNLEQRQLIKRLLDELDSADEYFKKICLENKQLKKVNDKIENLLIIKKTRCLNEGDYILNVSDLDDILDILNKVSE